MKTNDIKTLRKKCKRLLFDLEDAGKINSQPKRQLAKDIGVSYGSLVMSLSGYRSGNGSITLLVKLRDHLKALKSS